MEESSSLEGRNICYDVRNEKCKIHPDQHLTSFCLTQGCPDKLLCVLCFKDHSKWHKCYNPVQDIVTEKHVTSVDVLITSLEKSQLYKKHIKLFHAMDSIFEGFDLFLNDYRNLVREFILHAISNPVLNLQTDFKSSNSVLKSCLNDFAKDGIHLNSRIGEYTKAYLDIQRCSEEFKKSQTQSLGKIEEVAHQIEKYFNDMKNNLEAAIGVKTTHPTESVLNKLFLSFREEEKTQEIWQIDTDKIEFAKTIDLQGELFDLGLCFLEQDNLVAIGGSGEITFHDLDDLKIIKNTVKTEPISLINKILFLKDKGLLVTISVDHLLTIWDYELNMKSIGQQKFKDAVYSIEYIQEKECLVCGGYFSDLYILSLDGSLIGKLSTEESKNFQAIKWIPEKNIVVAYCEIDGRLWIYDFVQKTLKLKVEAHEAEEDIGCIRYDSQKQFLYSCGGDGKILVWKLDELLNQGKPFKQFEVEDCFVGSIELNCSREGDFLTLCSNRDESRLVVWNIENPKPKKSIKLSDDPAYSMLRCNRKKQLFIKPSKSKNLVILEEPGAAKRSWWLW